MNKIFNDDERCGNCKYIRCFILDTENFYRATALTCTAPTGGQPPESLRLKKEPSFERDSFDVCGNFVDLDDDF